MYLRLVVLSFLLGCSTTLTSFFEEGESTQQRNEKLVVEDFKDEKDVFEKFKENKTPEFDAESSKKMNVLKTGLNQDAMKIKKPQKIHKSQKRSEIRPPKLKKNLLKKDNIQKKDDDARGLPETDQGRKDIDQVYGEDFPEELKDYDGESEKFWKSFRPIFFPGEKIVFNITYLGVNTGKITLSIMQNTQIGGESVYHVNARVKTASFYSYLYEVDDYCDSYLNQKNFVPLKFSLIQRQSTQDIDDLQLFDQKELKAYSFYKRVTKDKVKKKKLVEAIPKYFHDPLSVVYFVRGLPMDPEVKYSIPIINQGKVEILNAQYEKTELIQTKLGEKMAYKVIIYTKHEGETIKGGSMIFWYSADEKRIFLKFDAKIKIGSVSGEIESYAN